MERSVSDTFTVTKNPSANMLPVKEACFRPTPDTTVYDPLFGVPKSNINHGNHGVK